MIIFLNNIFFSIFLLGEKIFIHVIYIIIKFYNIFKNDEMQNKEKNQN